MIEALSQLWINNKVFAISILLAMFSGLSFRIMLTLVKQKWVSTYHHTMSYTLLPLITLVITKTITGNIALSLGMIGALSIVRFRNPVKNPFELVMFFALITIGISMAVNVKYGLLLAGAINSAILASYLIEIIGSKLNFHTYSLSFDEGNSHNILEIQAKNNIPFLENHKLLLQYINDKSSGIIHYRLVSRRRSELEGLRVAAEKDIDILNIELRLV